jgi:hypothetical protein
MACFFIGYVSMPVPDDDFIKRPKRVARFGKLKVLSENTRTYLLDGPSVCLLQKY